MRKFLFAVGLGWFIGRSPVINAAYDSLYTKAIKEFVSWTDRLHLQFEAEKFMRNGGTTPKEGEPDG